MTTFTDNSLQLQKLHADYLLTIKGAPLEIKQHDLLALIKSPDIPIVLEAFQLIESANLSEPIHQFEYVFAQ